EKQPSSVLAVAYADLVALRLREKSPDGVSNLLKDAVDKLKLAENNFSGDAATRKKLQPEYGFERPETYLLFMAGLDAFNKHQNDNAIDLFRSVIKTDPASGYAWQALAMLDQIDEKITQDKVFVGAVLDQYPAVFGTAQECTLN